MKHILPPGAFFERNRDAFLSQMLPESAAIFRAAPLVYKNADEHHPYEQYSDFFYLTGIEAPLASLVLYPESKRHKQALFIERPDPKVEEWTGKRITETEAKDRSGCQNIAFSDNFDEALANMLNSIKVLYLNYYTVPLTAPLSVELQFAQAIRDRFPHLTIVRANIILAKQRLIKSAEEIELLREAIRITNRGLIAAMQSARPGMHEFEIQSIIEKTYKDLRSESVGFQTILASGLNACTLHYESNDCLIDDGSLVLADTGADYCHYSADITRTFPINGVFSARQREVYQKLLEIQKRTIELIKPGITLTQLNKQTREMLVDICREIGLKGETDNDYYRYIKHFVSHQLGLDAHDVPEQWDSLLSPGNVITVEPGIYIAEENLGIRIEDDILVTENGCEILSLEIPREISDIEALMRH
jgi:Xaa-Pro aminopeptidase